MFHWWRPKQSFVKHQYLSFWSVFPPSPDAYQCPGPSHFCLLGLQPDSRLTAFRNCPQSPWNPLPCQTAAQFNPHSLFWSIAPSFITSHLSPLKYIFHFLAQSSQWSRSLPMSCYCYALQARLKVHWCQWVVSHWLHWVLHWGLRIRASSSVQRLNKGALCTSSGCGWGWKELHFVPSTSSIPR